MNNPSGVIHYHQSSKHTPASVRYGSHRLDWNTKPSPFKQYLELAPFALPAPAPATRFPATSAIAGAMGPARDLDAAELARLLTLAAGIRRVLQQPPADPIFFRTYACAGALYPNEVYLACGEVEGIAPGLYHYAPAEDALRLLREGDPRQFLMRATGAHESVGRAPVSVIISGIPWRTAWKYKQRGYRHLFWDAGMILANLLALSASGGHPSEVVLGFDDEELNRLLGVDGKTEMGICVVPIGKPAAKSPPTAAAPPKPISHPVAKLSHWERSYDEVVQAHRETSLSGFADTQLWHQSPAGDPAPLSTFCIDGIEKIIRRRGSKRAFKALAIPLEELAGILDHATHKLHCDWGDGLVQVALIAHNVDELSSGAYSFVFGVDPIAHGDFREKSQFLCLDQPLGGQSAATLFLMSDLSVTSTILGSRGYRAAQLEAGIMAGRIYLSAYACGFGATGLTFYDDEVRSFFDTEAEPMIAVALGH